MTSLADRQCQALDKSTAPLDANACQDLKRQINTDWLIAEDNKILCREFKFKNFYRTMAFVNAVAYIAHEQDHHPDFTVSYNRCSICYSTHSVGGLSENDFICAAKIDNL